MYKRIVVLMTGIFILFSSFSYGKVSSNDWLVKIGNKTYTVKDFQNWWDNWKVDGSKFPETPTPFIDWMLLFENGTELGLYKYPSYQQKIRQFVKVRSLLLLQGDTLSEAKNVTDKEVEEFYKKEYLPLEKFHIFYFNDRKTAEKAKKLIDQGVADGKVLAERLGIKNTDNFERFTKYMRPFDIKDMKQRGMLFSANKGDVVGPLKDKDKWLIVIVVDKTFNDNRKKDFLKAAKEKLIKIREAQATQQLLDELKKKYKVKIYKDVLDKITSENVPEDIKNKVVLEVGNYALTAGGFGKFLKKEVEWQKHSRFGKVDINVAKKRVVDSIINQTLVGIEAINRHYERREPLKSMYEFYCQNRIIRELEDRIIKPQVKVTDKDIKRYYELNKEKYRLPDKVKFRFLQTSDKKLIEKLYEKVKKGADFKKMTIDIMGYDNVVTVPYNKLLPETKKVVDNLESGEVSAPIKIKDTYFLLQLLEKHRGEYKPLAEVRESIEKVVWEEKFKRAKEDYVKKLYMNLLMNGKEIKVNWDVWNEIVNRYKNRTEFNGKYAFYLFLISLMGLFIIGYIKGREKQNES
ncbi:peptidyl-prolyl cis-trans isomerase [Desulfurobacterium atlanticum]|uniref:peptidylprolyl isomerase n=1 Tax=Desulfurobacterium atlanticum TaxID=240169 RepID=A0A238YGW7_9BACT|nr:peptidylprolyl isomerase [Desulfurobacterium atlanticum]SNR70377.1 PPIC-type PPIASE domain-containing protein [Desulfurobacterium atlanticum]